LDLDRHLKYIATYRTQADALHDDNPGALMEKIDLLAKCLVYIGRVSSFLDGEHKRIYGERKYQYALAEIAAKPPRQAHAEIAVRELRQMESQAYEDMKRWRNGFESTQEELHAKKLKLKIDHHIDVQTPKVDNKGA
jgi:hypothetical protein